MQGSSTSGGSIPITSVVQVPPPLRTEGSQTQDETQLIIRRHPVEDLKRKSTETEVQSNKKIKISMGPAVDLQD